MVILNLEIVEYCDPIYIISREQYYLDVLKPEYNVLTIERSPKGFKHTQKTKRLLRHLGLNRIRSENSKIRISINIVDLRSSFLIS